MGESYAQPNSLRNILFSAMIVLAGWNGLWLFWLGIGPRAGAPRGPSPATVFAYAPGPAEATGITWRPVMIGPPNRIGLPAGQKDPAGTAFLEPVPMAPRYAETVPGGRPPDPDGSREWAESSLEEGGARGPLLLEPSVFPAAPGSGVSVEVSGELRACGFVPGPIPPEVVSAAGEKWIAVTAAVTLEPGGRERHVFLESHAGIPEVDRAILQALYTGRGVDVQTACTGRVRVRIAGARPAAATKE